MGDPRFNQQAVGVGNASETVFDTNGIIFVPVGQELDITDYVCSMQGAGFLRVRADNISGAIVHQRRFAADGEIIGDSKTPLILKNTGTQVRQFVLTYQGAFTCAWFMAGRFDTLQQ